MTNRSPQAVSPKRGLVCGLFVRLPKFAVFDDYFTLDFNSGITIDIET